jgi:hypothetical protein
LRPGATATSKMQKSKKALTEWFWFRDGAVTVNCQKVVQPGIEPGTFCDQFHKCETEIITIRPLNLSIDVDLKPINLAIGNNNRTDFTVGRRFSVIAHALQEWLSFASRP